MNSLNKTKYEELSDREVSLLILKKLETIEEDAKDLKEVVYGNETKGIKGLLTTVKENSAKLDMFSRWKFTAGVIAGFTVFVWGAYNAIMDLISK